MDLEALHELCHDNRAACSESALVGCFDCCRIFKPSLIREWARSGPKGSECNDAICPFCWVDSILPGSKVELTVELLEAMERRWFGLRERMR